VWGVRVSRCGNCRGPRRRRRWAHPDVVELGDRSEMNWTASSWRLHCDRRAAWSAVPVVYTDEVELGTRCASGASAPARPLLPSSRRSTYWGCRRRTGPGSPACSSGNKKRSDKALSSADNPWQDCLWKGTGRPLRHPDRCNNEGPLERGSGRWRAVLCGRKGTLGSGGKQLASVDRQELSSGHQSREPERRGFG
jgi:hypothetical protein